MINKRKVRLMARTAMYEAHEGPSDFALSKYSKLDYVGLHMWTTAIAVTIAYILVLLLLAAYNFEYIIANITKLNYSALITVCAVGYFGALAVFILIAYFVFSYRFSKAENGLRVYHSRLKKIFRMNKEDRNRKE